jgi:proline-specific peptidase
MAETGFVSSVAGDLFYQKRGSGPEIPLVVIHGGPGFTSYALEPLFDLSGHFPVVCYDQAGCGRSRERCPERKDFSIAGFVAELEALREHLGAPKIKLLGHSFGGLIAGEYALRYPERVEAIVFACVSIDIPRWMADAERLISRLPMMTKMILKEGLRSGAYSSQAFLDAYSIYIKRHIYGFDEKPECIIRSEAESDHKTYQIMWGANEILVTGVVRDYNLCNRLPLLKCPTLFVCGRNDEATPEAHEHFASLVNRSELHIFEASAHHPQLTERDAYLEAVSMFFCSSASRSRPLL